MSSKYILLLFIFGLTFFASSQNVPPTISDPEQLETIRKERQLIFDQLLEEPTNQSNLFKYANLSIILGDLEAAIGVFEQMLIYDPTLARIRLELGVLYFRLEAYAPAKLYLDSVKDYDPPEEVVTKVESFLSAIEEQEKPLKVNQLMTFGFSSSTNANAGIDADIIEIAGFPLEVSPDSKPQSDSKLSLNYNVSLTQNLNNPRGDSINYFLALATTYQSRFTQFDQRSLVFGINSKLEVEEGRLGILKSPSVTPSFTRIQVYLSGEALLESNAFSVSHSGTLENGSNFDYGFNIDKRNFIGLEAKSGYRYGTFVNNTFFLPNNNSSWTLNVFSDKYEANEKFESFRQWGFGFSYRMPLPDSWVMATNYDWSTKNYLAPNGPLGIRKDINESSDLTFSRLYINCLSMNIFVKPFDNRSSIDIFSRSNTDVGLNLSYLCLNN